MRIFIDSSNTTTGAAICKELYSNRGGPESNKEKHNRIYGTLKKIQVTPESIEYNAKPPTVHRVIESWAFNKSIKDILSCAAIVYDLHSTDHSELESLIKALKVTALAQPTVFILISSVMVWARNVNEYETVDDTSYESEEVINEETTEGSEAHSNSTSLPKGQQSQSNKKYERRIPLASADYAKRLPYPKYSRWKYLETLVMSLKSVENLETYVIGAGILYGNGETVFHEAFKSAWLDLKLSHVIGVGDNIIPTLHVNDLASLVRTIIETTPEAQYHIAVDTSAATQHSIIQGIVDSIGEHYEIPRVLSEDALLEKNVDIFTLDILMEPSDVMMNDNFVWHSREGLINNMTTVLQEYRIARNLKAIQICVLGPPGSGKSFFSAALAKRYCIPHIQLHDFMNEFKTKQMFIQQLLHSTSLHQRRQSTLTKQSTEADNRDEDSPNFIDLIQNKLESCNACKNRGFILDGFPRSYDEARELFSEMVVNKREETTAEHQSDDDSPINTSTGSDEAIYKLTQIAPDFVIDLNSSHVNCKNRLLNLQKEHRIDGYNNEAGYNQRRRIYKENNSLEYRVQMLSSFFQEHSIEMLTVDVDANDTNSVFSSLCIYIEKYGNCPNFLTLDSLDLHQKEKQLYEEKQNERHQKEEMTKEKLKMEEDLKYQRKMEENERLQMIREHELSLLEARSIPLRRYLMKYVIPTLSKGLVEVAKAQPEDPIDYLADYLIANSHHISDDTLLP